MYNTKFNKKIIKLFYDFFLFIQFLFMVFLMSLTSPFCYPDKIYRSSHYFFHFSSSFLKQIELHEKYKKYIEKDDTNELLFELYKEMIDNGCSELLLELMMDDDKFRFVDYYRFYKLSLKNNIIHDEFLKNKKVIDYIKKFFRKNRNLEKSFGFIYKNNNNNDDNESCVICMEIMKDNEIIQCKQCKKDVDKECFMRWIEFGKRNCVLCNKILIEDNLKNEKIMKYLDWKKFD